MAEYLTEMLQHARQWQSVEEGSRENKQMKSDRRRVADGMQYRKSLRTFLPRLSMPKLVAQCLAVTQQVSQRLSQRGAAEPVVECLTGTQRLSRHVGDGLPERGASERVA